MRPKKVVLIVDGSEKELSLRRFLLETWGYRVLATTSGTRALAKVEEMEPGTLDLLLCNLEPSRSLAPAMDGNEIVRRAKLLRPELPTMLTSRKSTDFYLASAADVFLPRPANIPAELHERVRVLVARRRGPKPRVKSGPVEDPCEHARRFAAREMAA
jgi:two-component system, OmpR family, response regulator CpxR